MIRPVFVIGTVPELVKASPIIYAAYKLQSDAVIFLTGQHSVSRMVELCANLGLKDVQVLASESALEPHSSRSSSGTSRIIGDFDVVVVTGDTRSALLGATAGYDLGVPVVHLEAGLRLSEISEPEESIRRRISKLTSVHVTPGAQQTHNLITEGCSAARIDTAWEFSRLSLGYRANLGERRFLTDTWRPASKWITTVHRVSNLRRLEKVAQFLVSFSRLLEVSLSIVRRPDTRLASFYQVLESHKITLIDPWMPVDSEAVMRSFDGVVTDSAGLQQECALLGVRSCILRKEVELYRKAPQQLLAGNLDLSRLNRLSALSRAPGLTFGYEGWLDESQRIWRSVCCMF
ncbi:UDP-N-acetylglucosamine 2-epimerase [Nocardia wallacei]|uniref:UDP-N-acetylglucosamine 2-epimerase n=1 Tax=Nocardia wallacei TaxID=480035 RepID=UPI003CC7F7D0